MTEERPDSEQDLDLIKVRKDLENLKTELKGDIRELKTGVEKDIDYLKRLVYGILVPLLVAVVGGILVAIVRAAGLV